MSNNADFINIQRRLMNLLDNGHNMQPDQLERALDGLVGATRQAVRQQQPRYVVTPPSSPPPARARTPEGPPPAMRTAPQFIELRTPEGPPPMRTEPQFIELRPTAELRPAVRPSVLIREMRAQMGWTARFEAPIAPIAPVRGKISWATYSLLCMKKRAIGKARYEAECKETCAICLDKHTNGESVLTEECKHCFGKECWKNWISNPSGNQKCPTCREECPTVLTYTLRAERRPRANAIVEVDLTEN
jgi:hypothetical protein